VAGRDQVCPALYHASNHVLALQVQAGKKPASEMGNSSLCLQKLHVLTCAQYAHIKADVCVPAGTAADVLSHVLYQGPYGPLSGSAMMYVLGERSGQVSELHFEYTAATGLEISPKESFARFGLTAEELGYAASQVTCPSPARLQARCQCARLM